MSTAERVTVINAVWDNLGRVVGELPHLATLKQSTKGPGWEIEGEEHIEFLKATGAQALFFSGHLGNWEMILPVASSFGLAIAGFYRPASNKRADVVIQSLRERALNRHVSMFRKGPEGARAVRVATVAMANKIAPGDGVGFINRTKPDCEINSILHQVPHEIREKEIDLSAGI
jgi:lauroyl/myristoyl acyltransferase